MVLVSKLITSMPTPGEHSYWSLARINTAAGQFSDPTAGAAMLGETQCESAISSTSSPGPPCQRELLTSVRLIIMPGDGDGLLGESTEGDGAEQATGGLAVDTRDRAQQAGKKWMLLINTTAEDEGHGWLYSVEEVPPSSGNYRRTTRPLLQPIEDMVCSIISLRPGPTTLWTAQHLHHLLDNEVQLPDVVLSETAQDWCLDVIFKLESEGYLESGQAIRLQDFKDRRAWNGIASRPGSKIGW